MIENQVGHADKHVLLDVGIKLSIHLLENIGWRRVSYRLTAQDAPADCHDERCGNAFARNIRDANAESFLIDFDVIKIIAADLARRHVHPADLKPTDARRFGWKKNALNVARDFKVVIESLLFVRLRINNRVVERECRLLGDRFKNDEIVLRKWRAHAAGL